MHFLRFKMEEPLQYIQFLLCLFLFNWNSFASGSASELDEFNDKAEFKIEGKVYFSSKDKEWTMNTRILVDGGNYLGFVKSDGSFVVHGIPSGSYIVEVANPDALFETVRVEITSKGKMRARRINLIQPNLVKTVTYPLEFRERGKLNYFHKREQWRLTDFLFNPMVLTMIVPLLLIMVLPKLMNAADVDTQKVVHAERSNLREADLSVTNEPESVDSSEQHSSELLQLSQKPHKASKYSASPLIQSQDTGRSITFKFRHQNIQEKTEQSGESIHIGKQRSAHSSKKLATLLSCETNNDIIQELFFSAEEEYESSSSEVCPTKSTEDYFNVHVDVKTKTTSPSKLLSLQQYKTIESSSTSKARIDLSLEINCGKNKNINMEKQMSEETVLHCNINHSMNDQENQISDNWEQNSKIREIVTSSLQSSTQPSSELEESDKESDIPLAGSSKDSETALILTNSDLTRTDESITSTYESLLNFEFSDEDLLPLEETDFSSENSSSLEMSKSSNASSDIKDTGQLEPHQEKLDIHASRYEKNVTLTLHSSGPERDNSHAETKITDFPTQAEEQS